MKKFFQMISIGYVGLFLPGCLPVLSAAGSVISGVNGAISMIQQAYDKQPEPSSDGKQKAYKEGFRMGMKSVATEFRTKEEMNKPYVWRPPLVSDVDMPARVINGVMIPAHTEPVIVSPGYWIKSENVAQD